MFLPFVRSPQYFSKHLQLTELSSQLAESALLVKLTEKRGGQYEDHDNMKSTMLCVCTVQKERWISKKKVDCCVFVLSLDSHTGVLSDTQSVVQEVKQKQNICWCLACHQNALSWRFLYSLAPGDGVDGELCHRRLGLSYSYYSGKLQLMLKWSEKFASFGPRRSSAKVMWTHKLLIHWDSCVVVIWLQYTTVRNIFF